MSTSDRSISSEDEAAFAVEPPANVLLLAPAMSGGHDECSRLDGGLAPTNLLVVSLTGAPETRLDAWRRGGTLPEQVAVITCGETRSATGSAGSTVVTADNSEIRFTTISDPSDLTGMGIKISQCLSRWGETDGRSVVCFDSLTTLLQYVDIQRVFRFLHVLTRRVGSFDGVAHFHMDPTAHDEQTLVTLRSLFDHVVTFDDTSGNWRRD